MSYAIMCFMDCIYMSSIPCGLLLLCLYMLYVNTLFIILE